MDFMNLYEKHSVKRYSFLAIDASLSSDNSLRLWKNLFERIKTIIMTIDDKIRDEKIQHYIKKGVKIFALSSQKVDKH